MQTILDLQKLEAPGISGDVAADSCTSSWSNCCNGQD